MDVALLLERDSVFARCFKRAAVALGHLSEKDTKVLAAVLPSDVASFLRSVSELVRAHHNEPLEAVLPAAFDTYWTDHLRAIVDAKLRELALPSAHRRSTIHKAAGQQ